MTVLRPRSGSRSGRHLFPRARKIYPDRHLRDYGHLFRGLSLISVPTLRETRLAFSGSRARGPIHLGYPIRSPSGE